MYTGIKQKDIAAVCGVSVSTVSKALHDSAEISGETIALVLSAAEKLGYGKNRLRSGMMVRKHSRILGAIAPYGNFDLSENIYLHSILSSFSSAASARGFETLFIQEDELKRKASLLALARFHRLDGICLMSVQDLGGDISDLLDGRIPLMSADYLIDGCPGVICSHQKGMYLLLEYCKTLGHTNLAFIDIGKSPGRSARLWKMRQNFYTTAGILGLSCFNRFPSYLSGRDDNQDSDTTSYKQNDTNFLIRDLLSTMMNLPDRPSCLVCSDDITASRCIEELMRLGLKVPDNVSVAGFGACSVSGEEDSYLTTVRLNPEAAGALAANKLINLIEEPGPGDMLPEFIEAELIKGYTVKDITAIP